MAALLKTKGIVLRQVKYGETSFILDIFTEEKGRLSFIINGIRKANAKTKAAVVQLMSHVELVAYYRPEKNLHRIKEVKLATIYTRLPFEVMRGTIALFMCELAAKTLKEETANKGLFDFLTTAFLGLDQYTGNTYNWHLSFMLHLTHFLGCRPQGTFDAKTSPYFDFSAGIFVETPPNSIRYFAPENSQLLSFFNQSNFEIASQLPLNGQQRHDLLNDLLLFYYYHIESMSKMKTHEILAAVMR